MRVVVTGGSGLAGRAVVDGLVEHGFDVLNVDLVPSAGAAPFLRADLGDLGQVYGCLRDAEAVVHFEDTTPLAISTPGSPNTIAAPSRSAWQQDMIIIRVRAKATWAVIAPGGVQCVTNTKW